MSRSLTYTFPPGNVFDVCTLQTLIAPGNLQLNGNLANSTWSAVDFLSHGYSRSISITSFDGTASQFTVTGFQNGVPITEVVVKPGAGTLYSNQIFDVITSISVNVGLVGIGIGTGYTGFFPLIGVNLERDVVNYTIVTSRVTALAIDMAVYGTISDISQNGHTLLDIKQNDSSVFSIKDSASEDNWIYPTTGSANQALDKFIFIYIDGGVGDIANSVQMTFVQI